MTNFMMERISARFYQFNDTQQSC